MATFGISFTGVDRVVKRMADLPAKLDAAERAAVLRGQLDMEKRWIRAASGEILKKRTAAYAGSIGRGPLVKTALGYEGTVGIRKGKADKYAKIHETGGTIRAKKKVLAIPIGDNRRPDGTARYASSPRDARAWGGFWKRIGGSLYFMVPSGRDNKRGSKISAWFIGVPSVTIMARRPMGRSFDEIRPSVLLNFDALVKRAINA